MKVSTQKGILIASVAVTLLLYIIPFGSLIAYPLLLLSTMAHEFGHGIAALLVGAHFDTYHMWADGSGQALIRSNNGAFGQAFIAAGGLVGPSIAAAVLFILAKYPHLCRATLYTLCAFLALSEILLVRGLFAMLFNAALCVILYVIARQKNVFIAQFTMVFVAVQLSLSVFSRGDYLFTPTAMTAQGPMPSDVMQIQNALLLPYWLWGAFCALFSLCTLLLGLRFYIKNR